MLSWAPMCGSERPRCLLRRRPPSGAGQAFYKMDLDSGRITKLLESTANWTQPGAARGAAGPVRLLAKEESPYLSVNNWNENLTEGGGGVASVNLSTGKQNASMRPIRG